MLKMMEIAYVEVENKPSNQGESSLFGNYLSYPGCFLVNPYITPQN